MTRREVYKLNLQCHDFVRKAPPGIPYVSPGFILTSSILVVMDEEHIKEIVPVYASLL